MAIRASANQGMSMRLIACLAVAILTVFGTAPNAVSAQECDLPEESKTAAAEAFNDILSVLRHPRCANCHGALNLYEPNPKHPGGSIVKEVAQEPQDDLFSFGGEPTTTTTIRGPEDCAGCHGKAAGQWTQKSPDSEIQWAGLDDRGLWNRLQRTRVVTDRSTMATENSTGANLIGHVQHDLLIALAFEGDRAISDDKRIYFSFERDPPPLSKDKFIDALERWVDALDARQSWPEGDCSGVLDDDDDSDGATAVAAPPAGPTAPEAGTTETQTGEATPPEPEESEPEAEETVTVDPCEGPLADLAAADERIAAGDFGAAETAIANIDASECPEVAEAIPSRETNMAARVDEIVTKVGKAADSCDAATMDGASAEAAGIIHPRIDEALLALSTAQSKVVAAEDAYRWGSAAFEGGDWATARSSLEAAKASWEAVGLACGPQTQRVDVGISKIDRVAGAEAQVAAAVADCDLDLMALHRQQLLALESPHPRLAALAQRLASDIETCKANDPAVRQAAAEADCRSQYGSGYRAGGLADDGSYFCLPDQATANAWCNANNQGSGWVAGKVRYNGAFDCRLNEAGRNAACAAQNGAGWLAGRVQSDGSYPCYMGRSARNTWCWNKYGSGWRSGDLRSDGSFDCLGPPSATGQSPSSNDAAAAAAAAAIAGSIIQGIIQSQGGGGGTGQHCHRNPTTGQTHCGAN